MNTTKKYTPPVSKTIYIDSAAICALNPGSPQPDLNRNEEADKYDGLAKGYNGSWDDEDNWEW